MTLTAEQVSRYREEGYSIAHSFLGPTEVEALLAELESICAGAAVSNHDPDRMEMEPGQAPEGTRVRRVYEPCTHYPAFRTLSESGKLLDAVAQLLGPDLTFHYSKVNMKPPQIGSVVEWHQDLAYYPLTNPDSTSILFYLDDATITNGCLKVIPARHTGDLMDHTRGGWFQGRITEPVDESLSVHLEGNAGSVIFMHSMTPHASAPNQSPQARRTLILSYRAADAFPVYFGEGTYRSEAFARHARGEPAGYARFSMRRIAIPRYAHQTRSLYELQALSRSQEGARS